MHARDDCHHPDCIHLPTFISESFPRKARGNDRSVRKEEFSPRPRGFLAPPFDVITPSRSFRPALDSQSPLGGASRNADAAGLSACMGAICGPTARRPWASVGRDEHAGITCLAANWSPRSLGAELTNSVVPSWPGSTVGTHRSRSSPFPGPRRSGSLERARDDSLPHGATRPIVRPHSATHSTRGAAHVHKTRGTFP
jgi:hypothetical protein